MDEIEIRRDSFRADLYSSSHSIEWVFHKHILNKSPYVFLNNPDQEHDLAKVVKEYFNVEYKDFVIIGSAQLGYSLNPNKNYRSFNEKSDLDIAIIDGGLFFDLKKELYEYTDGLSLDWSETTHYSKPEKYIRFKDIGKDKQKIIYWSQFSCYKYISKGWFRADFKPKEFEICRNGKRFSDFEREIYKKFSRKVGLAIYENWFFFVNYHMKNLENLKLITEIDPNVAK